MTISLRNGQGNVILKRQVSTRPEKTRAFLDDVRSRAGDDGFMAVLEVCGFNDWLIELLGEVGCREVVFQQQQKPAPATVLFDLSLCPIVKQSHPPCRRGLGRITDFGLAKRIEGNSRLTATGTVIGTPIIYLTKAGWFGAQIGVIGGVIAGLLTPVRRDTQVS